MDLYDELRELKPKRIRSRFVASAGGIAFVAGTALAGQCMIWMGMFQPGTTPIGEVLDYWPGFLTGGVLLGFLAAYLAHESRMTCKKKGNLPARWASGPYFPSTSGASNSCRL